MGCDSTGVEPGISHIIFKDLAGGGTLKLINKETGNALANLGYSLIEIKAIEAYVSEEVAPNVARGTLRGAPYLNPEHYAIFDTAFGNKFGEGSIHFEGHVRMLGATQPFISGAISKTNNLPKHATVKDIYDGYLLGHDLRLKAISVFRDGSKPATVLNFGDKEFKKLERGEKEEMPNRRAAFEWEGKIGGIPLHIMASEYEDGRPGQIVFLSYRAGSTLGANLQTAGIGASKAFKKGVEIKDFFLLCVLEYLGQVEVADNQEGLELSKLHGAENGAFRTYARRTVDEWDFASVMKDPETGGFVEATGLLAAVKKSTKGRSRNNSRGLACTICGDVMEQTAANCYTCRNSRCRNKYGGCGI